MPNYDAMVLTLCISGFDVHSVGGSWQHDRLVATPKIQLDETFLRNVEFSWANALWFQQHNNHDTRRRLAPCISRSSHPVCSILSHRKFGALQGLSGLDFARLDEGCLFNISPDGQLFDQRGAGRPPEQSAGRTAVLSAI